MVGYLYYQEDFCWWNSWEDCCYCGYFGFLESNGYSGYPENIGYFGYQENFGYFGNRESCGDFGNQESFGNSVGCCWVGKVYFHWKTPDPLLAHCWGFWGEILSHLPLAQVDAGQHFSVLPGQYCGAGLFEKHSFAPGPSVQTGPNDQEEGRQVKRLHLCFELSEPKKSPLLFHLSPQHNEWKVTALLS